MQANIRVKISVTNYLNEELSATYADMEIETDRWLEMEMAAEYGDDEFSYPEDLIGLPHEELWDMDDDGYIYAVDLPSDDELSLYGNW